MTQVDILFNTTLQRFQESIETSIKEGGSEFLNESVALLYYNFQEIDVRRAESYIKSPKWLAHKEVAINPENEKDNKFFQYALTIALN